MKIQDLESISQTSTPTSIIPTKFEVDITIHCRVIAFLSAHTSRDLVTVTFDLLTLNSWRTWRVMWPTLPPSLNTLCLSVLDLWVITFHFGYHRECVRGHCACAESRDPWVRGQKQLHFWNSRPRFAYSLYNFPWATTTIQDRLLSSVTNAKALDCVNLLCVTLWPWPLTFNSYHTWRVTWPTLPPSLKTLRLTICSWVTSYNSELNVDRLLPLREVEVVRRILGSMTTVATPSAAVDV